MDVFLGSLPSSLSTSSSSSSFNKRPPPFSFWTQKYWRQASLHASSWAATETMQSCHLYSGRPLLLLVLDAGRLVEDVFLDPGTEEAELSSSLS